MGGPADSGLWFSAGPSAKVHLIAGDAHLRSRWSTLLRTMGYAVIGDSAPQQASERETADLIVLLTPEDEAAAVELIQETTQGEHTPPVVVFGPASGGKWPKRALQAGAFAYLPRDARAEEQAGRLAAAVRFRQMQVKVQLLMDESERLCADLVGSFGHNSEKLQHTKQEVEKAQKALQGMQARIIKAFQ